MSVLGTSTDWARRREGTRELARWSSAYFTDSEGPVAMFWVVLPTLEPVPMLSKQYA